MKLNYKRTILVGFAFLLISAFWQAYDAIVPLILTNHFGLPQTASGAIMSIDNVLAVFLLPLFGAISDKVSTKRGKRTPFIFFGTVAAVISFICLTLVDNYQLSRVIAEGIADMSGEGMTEAAFEELVLERTLELTLANPWALIGFIATLLVVLVSMATFRSPAVALMPDVTPKPLRSKGNAIINLMGSIGGVLVLVLGIVFATGKAENALMSYTTFFMTISILMLVSLTIFMFTVKEPKWAAEARALDPAEKSEENVETAKKSSLSRGEKLSLFFILASVVLWYMGYNAVTSKYSVYAGAVLNMDFNTTLIIAQAAAIISYIPVGIISSKLGRKRTIVAGVVMLATAFGAAAFLTSESNIWVMNALFALAGIGWATINVNSYPMVVELAKSGDVGKYTGYYYTASMAAQIVTPILSGLFLDHIGMRTLFPYATIFALGALFTMLSVRHGDSLPEAKKDLLENLDVD